MTSPELKQAPASETRNKPHSDLSSVLHVALAAAPVI
jgi:hypothetical protein